jgi:hypothetical protein
MVKDEGKPTAKGSELERPTVITPLVAGARLTVTFTEPPSIVIGKSNEILKAGRSMLWTTTPAVSPV